MTNKKPKSYNLKPKDYTVLQVMIAIVLFVISLYCLRLAAALPLTIRSFSIRESRASDHKKNMYFKLFKHTVDK